MKRFLLILLFASVGPRLLTGDDHNPIGVTGAFEGVITTGGGYNVVNHSASRQIDDIVVPGAIGKYGLKMTRYYNSRRSSSLLLMGPGWSHEYLWTSSDDRVDYPNGNVWDNHCMDNWDLPGPLGVSDGRTTWYGYSAFRLADGGTVVFGSGGVATKIVDPYGQVTDITLDVTRRITRVTEPGGRYLQFFYEDPDLSSLLTKVEAHGLGNATVTDSVVYHYQWIVPGGQGQQPRKCLSQVDYSDGQHAYYYYDQDNSPDNPTPPCPCPIKAFPVLIGANDVRYRGPMRAIAYVYQKKGPHGAILKEKYWDGVHGHEGQGALVSSIDPPAPSPLDNQANFNTVFTESRGDGPSRRFTYTTLQLGRPPLDESCPIWTPGQDTGPAPQQFLLSYTDFKIAGNSTQFGYDANWYINSVTDANTHVTTYLRGPPPTASPGQQKGIGEIKKITYHDGTHVDYDYYPEGTDNISGHYLTSVTEYTPGGQPRSRTLHYRDANTHKITLTDYKDEDLTTSLARETFTYCDQADPNQCGPVANTGQMHGQIKTQRLKNRAYVHYKYDANGRGLLVAKTEPTWIDDGPTALNGPKTTYTYYPDGDSTKNAWADRLKTVTGPAPNWPYSSQASETYEYDRTLVNGITDLSGTPVAGRGLVTKITHADGKYQQFKYDAYGNKKWEDNELRNPTSYSYDEYNRPLSVTRPLNGITTYTYNPTNGVGTSLSHTTSNPDTVRVRTGASSPDIVTTNVYDENFRKTSSTVSTSTTWFHYDAVGNQDYVTDPRGTGSGDAQYTTYTDYDSRNRKWQVREPLGRTTKFFYDDGFNLTRTIRGFGTPEVATETKAYDGLNRLQTDTVPQDTGVNILTRFEYNPWSGDPNDSAHSGSLLKKVTDGESHNCQFEYDAAGLKTQMTYHDGSSQSWAYDDAHNLKSRITAGNETQNFQYDNRNRKTREWWAGWPADGEWRNFVYDDASHLQQATNGTGAYGANLIADVTRSYDDAGRLTLDRQTVYVNNVGITMDVNYPTYTDDGRLTRMFVNGANPPYDYTFSYDNMGRFETIQRTGGALLFQYHYNAASDEIQRDNLYNGVNQLYPRDELNRITNVELQGASSVAREEYDYYTIGRLRTVTRPGNKQDQFVYYLDGELKQATYNVTATPPPTPPPGGTPVPPVATAATVVTSTGFGANWRSVAGATGYRLDVSTSSTFATYVTGYQNLNVGNVTSRAVSGLTGNTTYYYRVRAYNANGTSGNSNVISVRTVATGQVATPTFQPDGRDVEGCALNYTFYVAISTTTPGAQIRWTIDGSTWNVINGSSGVASFTILGMRTLQAIAYEAGMTDSDVKSAAFSFIRDCPGGPGYPLETAGAPAGPLADLVGTFNYALDRAGNRTAVNNVNYSPNSINQYTSVGGSPVTNGNDHQLQNYSGFTYHYMRDQELNQITATGLTFDVAYDALGRSVKRTVNGSAISYFFYDRDKPILEYNQSNTLIGFNVYGKGVDEILERRAYGADNQWHRYFLNQDHEGSVTHLTDADGTIIERYRYDVFGTPLFFNGDTQISTTAYNNRFLFTGREYLGASVYDYRARVYHAGLGRFMSEDPKLFDTGDYNLFRYCHNDPIDLTDPMGLDAMANAMAVAEAVVPGQYEYNQMVASFQSGNYGNAAGWGVTWVTSTVVGVVSGTSSTRAQAGFRAARIAASERQVAAVLGKFENKPNFQRVAEHLGVKSLNIPRHIYDKMTSAQQWAANQRMLDRAIARGGDFLFDKPIKDINSVTGGLRQELNYLTEKGFKLSPDGWSMTKSERLVPRVTEDAGTASRHIPPPEKQ